jgi:hypothetical protein
MRCAQWAVRDCLPTAAYPVPQSVTEREQSCRSLIIEPEQIGRIGAARSYADRADGGARISQLWAPLGIFGRLAQAKVDPGCCQLPVVSVRCRRLEWGIWTSVRGGGSPGMLTWGRAGGSAPTS